MKLKMASMSVAILTAAFATTVPYLIGRFIGVYTLLPIVNLFTSTNHKTTLELLPSAIEEYPIKGIGSTMRYTETNETNQNAAVSGTCQSLGLDIDKIDEQLLQSTIRMEKMLFDLLSNETFSESHRIRTPRCEPLQVPLGPAMNHQRLHCDALLSNTYLHIYTWPRSGAASIDIFSCNAKAILMSLIPTIRDLVVLNKASSSKIHEEPVVRWHYKLRGERSEDGHSVFMTGDMDQFLCSYIDFDHKEPVVSVKTEYQTIDIFDTIDPRFKTREQYYASLRKDDSSYYSAHPELFRPDRIIYLDGILQSRYYGDAAYHEPLVHPALFTHPNPKRVAIIGGGEGATLREVLKHNTIQTVTMIEIDELMVNVSKQYIPEWSDCSMIVGSTPSCFDDPRAELFYTDGIAWFIDRYLNADAINDELLYDIIIMDALDPESSTEFSSVLYNTDDFMKALSNALRSDGILVTQLGENFHHDCPGFHYSAKKIEYDFMQKLRRFGFDRMEDYTEAHGGFLGVWKYKILFKCRRCSYSRWHATQANVELEMKKRSMKCVNDCNLFRYFDSATMMEYQYVSRVNEAVFCRDLPQKLSDRKELWCENRHGYDPELHHFKANKSHDFTNFELSGAGSVDSGTAFILSSITTNFSYVGLDVSTKNIIVLPATTNLIRLLSNESSSNIHVDDQTSQRWNLLNSLLDSSGVPCIYWRSSCYFISLRLLMTPTYNYMESSINDSSSISEKGMLPNISFLFDDAIYNPFISRNHFNYQWIYDTHHSTIRTVNDISS